MKLSGIPKLSHLSYPDASHEARSPMEGWIRSDSLPHLYKLDRKIQALSRSVGEVQTELRLAKVDQQRLCAQLRAQNETIKGGNSIGEILA